MEHVPLCSAYVWDCPACGKQHFGIPRVASLDEETVEMIEDEFVQADFVADAGDVREDVDPDDPMMMDSPVLISRVSILPRFVTCGECGGKFIGTTETCEDDDGSEPE